MSGSAYVLSGNRSTVGVIDLGVIRGRFNLWFDGGTGVEASVQRRRVGDTNWFTIVALGQPVTYEAGQTETLEEVERDVEYRINVTAITGGTLTVRATKDWQPFF